MAIGSEYIDLGQSLIELVSNLLSNPSAFKPEEIRTLRDQINSNLERAWEITGRSEDELTGVMMQISQVVARDYKKR